MGCGTGWDRQREFFAVWELGFSLEAVSRLHWWYWAWIGAMRQVLAGLMIDVTIPFAQCHVRQHTYRSES